MKCPIDQTTLVISERGGIEIDYCPDCRGVWLDRGELDKIIDRAGPAPSSREAQPEATGASASAAPRFDDRQAQQAAQQAQYDREHRDWQQQYGQAAAGRDRRGDDQYGQSGYGAGYGSGGGYGGQRRKKKDNWLSELFD